MAVLLPPAEHLTLICMSDTHSKHRKVSFDSCGVPTERSVVLHAGDFCRWPDTSGILDFNNWMGTDQFLSQIPKNRKLVVLGNHDYHSLYFWKSPWRYLSAEQMNFTLLVNELHTLRFGDVRIYSPNNNLVI